LQSWRTDGSRAPYETCIARFVDGPQLRTIKKALTTIGDKDRLARALRIPAQELDLYLEGKKPLPQTLFMLALDIVANGGLPSRGGGG
jgi:hypothetical protein